MAALLVEGLVKRFGRATVLRDVSMGVERGQIHGFLGPNGSGKTTTLRCVLGLLEPDGGRIEILGQGPRAIHRTAGRVAVVFDRPQLLVQLSAAANLAWAGRILGHRGGRTAKEALELVGIPHLAGQRAGSLSLGQSRRLSIARALLGRPEFLILDEPLSGLDAMGVRSMLALMTRLREEGLTLLLSSHQLHEVERVVTHVTVILDGGVAAGGALEQVLAGPEARLTLRTPARERALACLAALPGARLLPDPVEGDLLRVEGLAGGAPAAARALVAAGVEILALHPERRTLASVFDDLVDARTAPRKDAAA